MKKFVALILSFICIIMLSSCGQTTNQTLSNLEHQQKDELKIVLLIPGLLGDKSFFDQANEAIKLIEKELNADVKVIEMGTDQTKWYPNFLDASQQNYDLILTISDTVIDVLLEIAEQFPDQKYINIDASMDFDVPSNVYIMFAKMGEMSFLAGLCAALKAQELHVPTIGFIGGMDIPGINEFLIGYIDGARHINPDIKVISSYVGNFSDPGKGKETALMMYQQTPIIYQAAGTSGLGVFEAAKELRLDGQQYYAIGVDSDQAMTYKDSDPLIAQLIITSAMKQIPQYTLEAIKQYQKNELVFGSRALMGLKEKGVTIAKNEFYEELLSQESRDKIEAIEIDILDGKVIPMDTVGMPTEEVIRIRDEASR